MHTYHNYKNSDEDNRFKTISEFEDCIIRGAEITFIWNNATYFVERYGRNDKITIFPFAEPENEKSFETTDELLEFTVGSDRLRDVITKVRVIDRSF